jgi:hypothetical protein
MSDRVVFKGPQLEISREVRRDENPNGGPPYVEQFDPVKKVWVALTPEQVEALDRELLRPL